MHFFKYEDVKLLFNDTRFLCYLVIYVQIHLQYFFEIIRAVVPSTLVSVRVRTYRVNLQSILELWILKSKSQVLFQEPT